MTARIGSFPSWSWLKPRQLDPSTERPLALATIRRLYSFTNPHRWVRSILVVLVLIRALQLPLLSWGIAKILSGSIAHRDLGGLWHGLLALLALVLVTEINFVYRMRLALQFGETVVCDLRSAIFGHLLKMPMSFFHRVPLGAILSRVTSDVDVIRVGIQDVVFVSTVQLLGMIIAGLLMVYYDWTLFLVVVAFVPIVWLMIRYFSGRIREAYREVQETYSRLTASIAESVNRVRVIQAFCREARNDEEFKKQVTLHARNNYQCAAESATFVPLLEMNGQVVLSLIIVLGGVQVLRGGVGLDSLVQFLFLSELFFGPIPILGRQYNQALSAMAGAERVFALLDTPPDWCDAPTAKVMPKIHGQLEFRDVHFGYAPNRDVLRGISFQVRQGQSVALVGETGSGKSTITRLVSKLFLPTAGQVLVDGHDLREISSESLHAQLASVPQDNFLFSGTVLDNIRFARPDASEAEVRTVAERLDVLDLIERMPAGFLTEVGEKGGNLSLGERQILCFVRAMLADPKILVLDEATSAIDAVTEARLQSAVQRLLVGRTSVIVAHRLSTILHSDQILVLSEGRIVERGRHAELL
ncbi:MAG TPA: ABC transporter ATP-binding protein, partial [Polyangiaceae bacterium]|nr:ABC transporter ATP-binding protein [Polyangiaceae bacterium]